MGPLCDLSVVAYSVRPPYRTDRQTVISGEKCHITAHYNEAMLCDIMAMKVAFPGVHLFGAV